MTGTSRRNTESALKPAESVEKKVYQAPKLLFFGKVVDLTNSFTSNCHDDSDTACPADPGSNMGPKELV